MSVFERCGSALIQGMLLGNTWLLAQRLAWNNQGAIVLFKKKGKEGVAAVSGGMPDPVD